MAVRLVEISCARASGLVVDGSKRLKHLCTPAVMMTLSMSGKAFRISSIYVPITSVLSMANCQNNQYWINNSISTIRTT